LPRIRSYRAPRIDGELLKLSIEITEPTVAKYMVRHRKRPAQTWRTLYEDDGVDKLSLLSEMSLQPTNRNENPGEVRRIRYWWRTTVEVGGTVEQSSPFFCLIVGLHLNE